VKHFLTSLWERVTRGRPFRLVAVVDSADEIPDVLPRRGAVRVGQNHALKWLACDCPCKAHHRVMLNLDRSRRPYWELRDRQPLTVWPSVDQPGPDRRCHYFLRDGRVQWARDAMGYK
jgi:hypothetical protein